MIRSTGDKMTAVAAGAGRVEVIGNAELYLGDCLEVMLTLAAESVDSIVTDPPYGLGFMGKSWDHAVPGVPFWLEMLRVAKPGAFLAAFGGTRTSHRMACAIEDAGWELRDTLMWVYGSGFPKSHNGEWGGTALKPAWEPIILARKPLIGTVAANYAMHGTGAMNIDGCRVAIDPVADSGQLRTMQRNVREKDGWGMSTVLGDTPQVVQAIGRWPANVVHDGSEEVLALFPHTKSPAPYMQATKVKGSVYGLGSLNNKHGRMSTEHGDSGSAARFFYCAKASKRDRSTISTNGGEVEIVNNHPTVKPTDLMRWLCRLVTPPGGLILDPFAGSGSTGRGAVAEGFHFQGIEKDAGYFAIASERIAAAQQQGRLIA